MIRWLERNGYDMSYTSSADVDADAGAAAQPQAVRLQRPRRVLVGRAARQRRGGTRRGREPRLLQRQRGLLEDALGEQHRRLQHALPHARVLQGDALRQPGRPAGPSIWTGTWRDPRFSPPGDGGRPENALTGQLFQVNSGTSDIKVPAKYGKLRLWRNTAARGADARPDADALPGTGTLGYEWDVDVDNGFRPSRPVRPVLDDRQRRREVQATTAPSSRDRHARRTT